MSLPIVTLTGSNTIAQLIYNVNRIKTLAANTASTIANSTFQAALANTNSYIATKVNKSGDTMTGPLIVNAATQLGSSIDGVIIENSNGAFSIGNAAYIRRNNSSGDLEIYASSTAARNLILGSSSGAEDMRIDSSGNVGIGRTGPIAKLHVQRTAGTTEPIGIFEAAIGGYTGTSLSARNTLGSSNTYNLFTCITDSDADAGGPFTLFQVRGDGRVGILGSSINQSALRVNGSISVTSSDNDFGSGGNRAMIDLAGSVARMGAINGGGSAVDLALYAGSGEYARLTASGSFGIGSTSIPSNVRIQVIGQNRPLATDDTANLLVGNSDTAADDLGGSIGFQHNGSAGAMIAAIKAGKQNGTTNGGYLSFATRSDAAFATEYMRITSAGKVGIGTTTPNTTLDVTGTARATQGTPYTTYTANTKTLALTDNGYYTRCSNTSLITITIPNNSTVAFPLGSEMIFFQAGSGNVLFANAAGVTLNSKESLVNLTGQYSAATLKKIATNTWDLIGDLA